MKRPDDVNVLGCPCGSHSYIVYLLSVVLAEVMYVQTVTFKNNSIGCVCVCVHACMHACVRA